MKRTTFLSHIERVEAEICPACNRHRAKEESHWKAQTFWQKLGTVFTGLAFGAATVYAVFTYCLLKTNQELLERTTRPIIPVAKYPQYAPNGDVLKMRGWIWLDNFGHLPTRGWVREASKFSPTRLDSGPDPSGAPKEMIILPTGHLVNRVDYSEFPPPNVHGIFYLASIIDYGPDTKYRTRICYEFPLPNTSLDLTTANLCKDPRTNDIDTD